MGCRHSGPLGLSKAKMDGPTAVKIDHGSGMVDILLSVDLTLEALKAEVARLMQCDPSQLISCAITGRTCGAVPGSSDNHSTLTFRIPHTDSTRVTSGILEDDAMVQYYQV